MSEVRALKLEGAAPPPAAADPLAFGGDRDDDLPSRHANRPTPLWEFLTFRRMIAPIVLQVLFWLGVVGIIGAGRLSIFGGLMMLGDKYGSTVGGLLVILFGLGEMVLGPFLLRLYFEPLMMIFRIYDVLREIRDKLDRR